MLVEKNESTTTVGLYWSDLTETAQKELLELLGDNGNYDVVPICELCFEEEE